MNKLGMLLGMIAFIIVVVAIGPLATIWAVNTLFPNVAIPYAIDTWLSVVILGAFLRANVSIKKD